MLGSGDAGHALKGFNANMGLTDVCGHCQCQHLQSQAQALRKTLDHGTFQAGMHCKGSGTISSLFPIAPRSKLDAQSSSTAVKYQDWLLGRKGSLIDPYLGLDMEPMNPSITVVAR